MDPVKAQKLQAMNLYKKSDPFLQSLLLHSLIALACSLFCSYSYSFPNSFYTIKHLLFNSLPSTWSWFVNPSCLFVVVNFIVMFLIGESRLSGKQYSSTPPTEIYDEYVARARSLRRRPSKTCQEIKKEQVILDPTEDINGIETEDHNEVDEVLLKEENAGHDEDFEECEEYHIENEKEEPEEDEEEEQKETEEEEHVVQEQIEVEEEEEVAVEIPAEELNKRVEDFIARVNRQRWLEARFLVCST